MFQAVPPPIIRSSKLYTQRRGFVELFLLLTAIVTELELSSVAVSCACRAPDDERRNRLKPVKHL